jgi:ribokinase
MKVLVFGSLNIDLVFSVDHIVLPGETISSSALERSAGGKGANQASALAKAGMEVYMAGKIGRDGAFLLDLLRSYGVDTRRVIFYEGATGQALIQLDKKSQNSIVLYSGGNHQITPEEVDETLEAFGEGDMVLLQNEILMTGEIMRKAKARGLAVGLNPSPYDERIGTLPLELADLFFVNEIEGAALAGLPGDTPFPKMVDTLAERFPASEIVLTAGKAGAYYGFGKERARGEIVDLPVADTTAAGDTFTGYFLAARARGMNAPETLEAACKAASIAVSRKGAMASIPFAKEVFS